MSYSFHFPLWFGLLKIKSANRLRREERGGQVSVWRLGDMCFVWKRYAKKNGAAHPPKASPS
jgi:hypothetical protein